METTMQPLQQSAVERIRSTIGHLEVVEFLILTLVLTVWGMIDAIKARQLDGLVLLGIGLFIVQGGIILGTWFLYNVYILLTRGAEAASPGTCAPSSCWESSPQATSS